MQTVCEEQFTFPLVVSDLLTQQHALVWPPSQMFIHKILSVFYFIFYAQFRSVLKTHHGFNIQTLALIAVLELFICYDDDFFSVVVSDLWFSWLLAYLSPSTCNHKMTHKALIQTFFPGENV